MTRAPILQKYNNFRYLRIIYNSSKIYLSFFLNYLKTKFQTQTLVPKKNTYFTNYMPLTSLSYYIKYMYLSKYSNI